MAKYVAPKVDISAFNCPHCNAYAQQHWYDVFISMSSLGRYTSFPSARISQCIACDDYTLWYRFTLKSNTTTTRNTSPGIGIESPEVLEIFKIVLPKNSTAPLPTKDMPDEITNIYNEARNILNESPRGAAALLRLCVQNLIPHLGGKGENINNDIGELVKQGLNPIIQKSLDSLRVIGNNAVHPGQIDLEDDIDTANKLFKLLNTIVELTITRNKFVEEIYEELPEDAKEAIKTRDENNEKK